MTRKLFLLYFLVISFFTGSFLTYYLGQLEALPTGVLSSQIYPALRSVNTFFTDLKYQVRGKTAPKDPKVLIVEVGPDALETFGRWPWSRGLVSHLVDSLYALGVKAVGLDIFFPEAELALPDTLLKEFRKLKLAALLEKHDPDKMWEETISRNSKNLVLGWTTEASCFPRIDGEQNCPVSDPRALSSIPPELEHTKIGMVQAPKFKLSEASLFSAPTVVTNLPRFQKASRHAGFVNAIRDRDGKVRRSAVAMLVGGTPHPSMPLEIARIAKNDILKIALDARGKLSTIGFVKDKSELKTTPSGIVELNIRGGERTFPYVSVLDVFSESETIKNEIGQRSLAGVSKKDLFKDAYVIIGVTALGIGDIVPNPFDHQVPGVEMQATALDNILANDFLTTEAIHPNRILFLIGMCLIMTIATSAVLYIVRNKEALPIIALFAVCFIVIWLADFKLLFPRGVNLSTSFLYLEAATLFGITLISKYILEEQNRKFVKSAFTKYVSGAVVDNILKDPKSLQLGGEKRALTVLFTDIRNFTTFSETMDPKVLAQFLNEYFALMTQILFRYGGTLDKFIGDAIMAFFGAPLDVKTHGKNACRAAQEMIHALELKKDYFKEKFGVPVEMGVGINSGYVSVGNMGTEIAFQYTALGDQVNLASRMESSTKQYGVSILTTHFTLEEIIQSGETLPQYRIIDVVKVKGKEDAVQFIEIAPREWEEEGLLLFEQARELYREKKWDASIEKFKLASPFFTKSKEKMDGPCKIFIERALQYKESPPDAHWDGSHLMTSK